MEKKKKDINEVIKGLQNPDQKTLNSKFFYDENGSILFEKITKLKEYYITRLEMKIFEEKKTDISKILPSNAIIIEFGSGSNTKIKKFLNIVKDPKIYIPLDISSEYMKKNCAETSKLFPNIKVSPITLDFTNINNSTKDEILKFTSNSKKTIGFFPGSTIGNFEKKDVKLLLKNFSKILCKDNFLVIGVDLIKNIKVLENAYNDKSGITANFNLNILQRLNNEYETNFEISNFEHSAFFNKKKSRIEMHLSSKKKHEVNIGKEKINFLEGETIHTENSYKYGISQFEEIFVECGFKKRGVFTDQKKYYAVFVLQIC